jgi:prepilin-type N-terminal cleavage/methylation domain-containing protein
MKKQQRGYSLVEMLIVVAIVGIFSLIAVPQFVRFYRQQQIRGSVRQFNAFVRAARSRAIKFQRPYGVAISNQSTPGGARGRFELLRGTITSTSPLTITWESAAGTEIGVPREKWLEETVQFADSALQFNGGEGVYFLSNGTVGNMPDDGDPTIELYSEAKVPNNHCTLTVSTVGNFKQTSTTVQ